MRISFSKNAKKDLKRLPTFIAIHIIKKIRKFKKQEKGDIKKIKGSNDYRLRIGDYRVLFEYIDNNINILRIKHRSQIY